MRIYAVLWGIFFGAFSLEAQTESSALEKLMEGNQRYVESQTACHEDWTAQRAALAEGQTPFAIIVSCSDSRVPPEIIFDQTLGSLFVVRVAGNIVDDFAIGSIEYGVNVLGATLILVLGHANCGAVDAALKGLRFDNNIQEVLKAIEPAIRSAKKAEDSSLEGAIKANVRYVEKILSKSKPVLSRAIKKKLVELYGGYYDLKSGKVELL